MLDEGREALQVEAVVRGGLFAGQGGEFLGAGAFGQGRPRLVGGGVAWGEDGETDGGVGEGGEEVLELLGLE